MALGLGVGLVVLAAAAWLILRLGRKLPIKTFLGVAVVLLMVTSVAFLGNAVRSLQEADVVPLTRWPGWPRAPIFLAQSTGYWPSRETLLAQGLLTAVYLAGAGYAFAIRPRRARRVPAAAGTTPVSAAVTAPAASSDADRPDRAAMRP